MLRSGYKTEFPRHDLSDEAVQAAYDRDQAQKLERSHSINTSRHRSSSTIQIGDQVYMRNLQKSKFQPIFGPDTFTVLDVSNSGATIQNNRDKSTFRRHLDDLKTAPQSTDSEIRWFPPANNNGAPPQAEPTLNHPADVPAVALPPRRNPPRNARPPAYLQDYVRFATEV